MILLGSMPEPLTGKGCKFVGDMSSLVKIELGPIIGWSNMKYYNGITHPTFQPIYVSVCRIERRGEERRGEKRPEKEREQWRQFGKKSSFLKGKVKHQTSPILFLFLIYIFFQFQLPRFIIFVSFSSFYFPGNQTEVPGIQF